MVGVQRGINPFGSLVSSGASINMIWMEHENIWHELRHKISNNVVCVTSKGSDQPAHTRSLIRAFASRLNILRVLSYWLNIIWSVQASKQAVQARLSLYISKYHIVGNRISRLICVMWHLMIGMTTLEGDYNNSLDCHLKRISWREGHYSSSVNSQGLYSSWSWYAQLSFCQHARSWISPSRNTLHRLE